LYLKTVGGTSSYYTRDPKGQLVSDRTSSGSDPSMPESLDVQARELLTAAERAEEVGLVPPKPRGRVRAPC
jgi:hypothetical protein